jgi:hypothetical protein
MTYKGFKLLHFILFYAVNLFFQPRCSKNVTIICHQLFSPSARTTIAYKIYSHMTLLHNNLLYELAINVMNMLSSYNFQSLYGFHKQQKTHIKIANFRIFIQIYKFFDLAML